MKIWKILLVLQLIALLFFHSWNAKAAIRCEENARYKECTISGETELGARLQADRLVFEAGAQIRCTSPMVTIVATEIEWKGAVEFQCNGKDGLVATGSGEPIQRGADGATIVIEADSHRADGSWPLVAFANAGGKPQGNAGIVAVSGAGFVPQFRATGGLYAERTTWADRQRGPGVWDRAYMTKKEAKEWAEGVLAKDPDPPPPGPCCRYATKKEVRFSNVPKVAAMEKLLLDAAVEAMGTVYVNELWAARTSHDEKGAIDLFVPDESKLQIARAISKRLGPKFITQVEEVFRNGRKESVWQINYVFVNGELVVHAGVHKDVIDPMGRDDSFQATATHLHIQPNRDIVHDLRDLPDDPKSLLPDGVVIPHRELVHVSDDRLHNPPVQTPRSRPASPEPRQDTPSVEESESKQKAEELRDLRRDLREDSATQAAERAQERAERAKSAAPEPRERKEPTEPRPVRSPEPKFIQRERD